MRKAFGLLGLVIALGIGWFIFKAQWEQGPMHGAPPKQIIDVVGVKSDLITIGEAERMYLASHGTYATLDQLKQDNSIDFSPENRRGYNYSADVDGGTHFTVTATPVDPAKAGWPTLSINDSMQVTQQ